MFVELIVLTLYAELVAYIVNELIIGKKLKQKTEIQSLALMFDISLPATANMPAAIITAGHEKEERQNSS